MSQLPLKIPSNFVTYYTNAQIWDGTNSPSKPGELVTVGNQIAWLNFDLTFGRCETLFVSFVYFSVSIFLFPKRTKKSKLARFRLIFFVLLGALFRETLCWAFFLFIVSNFFLSFSFLLSISSVSSPFVSSFLLLLLFLTLL